ncbi:hypothetical protein OAN24_00315 [Pseudodesulfovibrio sp.]|nr:hypothetical protein [Pseudodesulfovibrio sp.]
MPRIIPLFILALSLLLASAAGAESFKNVKKHVDPQARYLFYMHGLIVETEGKGASSPQYGRYLYDRIVEHFEDRGLVVIEEVRGKTNPKQYAAKITDQVRKLMAKGVPAGNITVAGFSKGGHIALLVASSLGNPDVKYVVLAGCVKGNHKFTYDQFLKTKRGARLQGHILSIYASSDLNAGTCRDAIAQSSGNGLTFKEIRIKSGKGHGLFYQPRPEWVEPVAQFAKGGR